MEKNIMSPLDFNVRGSFCPDSSDNDTYLRYIRDSLGPKVVGTSSVVIGSCTHITTKGESFTRLINTKGCELIEGLSEEEKTSKSIRFDFPKRTGGYASYVITKSASDVCPLLVPKDLNVRLSVLDAPYSSRTEETQEFANTVRDSLGESIVGSSQKFIGKLVWLRGDGEVRAEFFEFAGNEMVHNLTPILRRCVAVRLTIRLETGGYKTWIITK